MRTINYGEEGERKVKMGCFRPACQFNKNRIENVSAEETDLWKADITAMKANCSIHRRDF